MAKMGRIQEWAREATAKRQRKRDQMMRKKRMMSRAMAQAGACLLDQRYFQLRP
jgi:hypothetical protein